MSLKPLRLLSTFCWYSLWARGDRTCCCVFLSSQLQKTPRPFSFLFGRRLWFGPQPAFSLFLVWIFPVWLLGEPSGPPHAFPSPVPHACSYSLHSKMWCFDFFFVVVFVLFCVFVLKFFPFLLRLCPEKKSFACFLLFLHTFVYIDIYRYIYHLHLSVFYSLCKNWSI